MLVNVKAHKSMRKNSVASDYVSIYKWESVNPNDPSDIHDVLLDFVNSMDNILYAAKELGCDDINVPVLSWYAYIENGENPIMTSCPKHKEANLISMLLFIYKVLYPSIDLDVYGYKPLQDVCKSYGYMM